MGRLDAAHSKAPSGRAAARSRASRGSESTSPSSRMAAAAAVAAASAARQEASHCVPAAPGPPASRTAGTTSVALRAGSAQCPGPCATTTCRTGGAVLR